MTNRHLSQLHAALFLPFLLLIFPVDRLPPSRAYEPTLTGPSPYDHQLPDPEASKGVHRYPHIARRCQPAGENRAFSLPSFTFQQVPSALAFQCATHDIISFIILTNMSISNNKISIDKCILRVLNLCSHEVLVMITAQTCICTVTTEWTYVRSVFTVWSYSWFPSASWS